MSESLAQLGHLDFFSLLNKLPPENRQEHLEREEERLAGQLRMVRKAIRERSNDGNQENDEEG